MQRKWKKAPWGIGFRKVDCTALLDSTNRQRSYNKLELAYSNFSIQQEIRLFYKSVEMLNFHLKMNAEFVH